MLKLPSKTSRRADLSPHERSATEATVSYRLIKCSIAMACRVLSRLLIASLLLSSHRTWAQNFSGVDPELQTAAETARDRSAQYWSGRSLPGRWSAPCPVEWTVRSGPGSGLTRFQFQHGEAFGWRMTLRGDRDVILRDVIPHEVDHTVRASLCRRPLPRWLDEGCASLVESEASHAQLRRTRRSMPSSLLDSSTIDQLCYPATTDETTRLYAEGFSLVEYLLSRGTPSDLLRVQRTAELPSRSLAQVYRVPLPQLLSNWHEWERKRLSAGTKCDCVDCPWHRRPERLPQSPSTSPELRQPSASQRPTLTIWTASWCEPCQQFHRDLANEPGFRTRLESKFQLVTRDYDQSPIQAAQQGIRSVPVFLGPAVRVDGYLGPDWLLKQLGLDVSVTPSSVPERTVAPVSPPPLALPPRESPVVSPPPSVMQSTTPAGASPSIWGRVMGLAPVVIPILTSLGVIGGTAATGGAGGVALMWLLAILKRRATRSSTGSPPAVEGGVASPARAPFPRQLDEAGELLGLRQSEGRVATLDALRGMFLDDELDKLTSSSDPQVSNLIRQIRTAVDNRVYEVAPLTTKG